MFRLLVFHFQAMKLQAPLYKKASERAAKKGNKVPWLKFPPYFVIIVGFLFIVPSLLVSSSYKVFGLEDRTIAVDPVISLMMTIAVMSGFGLATYVDVNLFESVGKGALKPDVYKKLLRFLKLSSWSTYVIWSAVTATVYVVGVATGVADPEQSIMRFMLVLRNASVVLCKFTLPPQIFKAVQRYGQLTWNELLLCVMFK